MNNTFNLKRFGLLFKKHTVENAKTTLLSIGVLVGLLFMVLGFCAYSNNGILVPIMQLLTFSWFLLFGGSIYTSLTFTDLSDKKKVIPALTLPASHFEKFLVAWIYSFVFFQAVLIGAFYLVDNIIVGLGPRPVGDMGKVINIFTIQQRPVSVFVIFIFFHALSFWGALFFEKLHFIKTALSFFIALVIFILFNNQLLKLLVKDSVGGAPFNDLGISVNEHFFRIEVAPALATCGWWVLALTILLIWVSAFLRLKEKEA